MIIDLTNPGKLPEEFIARLKHLESFFRKFEFSEELVAHDVYSLVKDFDDFCTPQQVVGIHCTRAAPESIVRAIAFIDSAYYGRFVAALILSVSECLQRVECHRWQRGAVDPGCVKKFQSKFYSQDRNENRVPT